MGKVTRHVEGRTEAQRAKVRRTLGPLRTLTVQPRTRSRYEAARNKFYQFLQDEQLTLPRRREALDSLLAEYVEHLWTSGKGRALASDTVAGLQDLDPKLKGCLALTWRLLRTWSVNEIPNRAPPLPEPALHAMVGWSMFKGHHDFALSLLVGYYALLRTGELCDLKSSSISMSSAAKPAVISLGFTKSGKRAGAAESVTLHVQDVLKKLWAWKAQARPNQKLVPSISGWRKLFKQCLEALKLAQFEFRPYSLRRGGATFWFNCHNSFDKLLVMGRWQAARTARIYLNEGLAMLTEMTMPKAELAPFKRVYLNSLANPGPKT
eukprot:Skav217814  [mRNA]  locus=scaffold889:91866:92831:+ [translate_table: standard]